MKCKHSQRDERRVGKDCRNTGSKCKSRELCLHKAKKMLDFKGNHQQINRQPQEWKNAFVNYETDSELILTLQ